MTFHIFNALKFPCFSFHFPKVFMLKSTIALYCACVSSADAILRAALIVSSLFDLLHLKGLWLI